MGAVLVPFFTEWANISFTQTMILQSWFMLWVFLLEIPTGTIADYLGRRKSLALGCIANAAGVIAFTITPNFLLLLLGEFLWAMAIALFSGADTAITYDSLRITRQEKESKSVLGKLEISRLTGYMIAAPIGSVIAVTMGLQMPVLLMSIPLTIGFIITLTLKEPEVKQEIKQKYFSLLKEGAKFFYKHKILQIIAIDMIVLNTIGYFIIWLYQPMLQQIGLSIAFFGIIHAAFVASQIFFIKTNKKQETLLGSKRRVLFASLIIPGAILITGGIFLSITIALIIVFIAGGLALSKKPLFDSYLNKYIPSEKRATILSTIFMFRTLALVIFNPILGLLAEWSINNTLIIIGTIAIAFSLLSKIEEKHLID